MREKFSEFRTEIDKTDFDNERFFVRGKDLSEMILNFDFPEAIFYTLLNKFPDYAERKLFNATMVAFHAGVEAHPPTTLFPRIATSVGASTAQALAAGYCAGGPLHVGAIEEAMREYLQLRDSSGENCSKLRKQVKTMLDRKEKFYGFGHPVLKKDPRPDTLRDLVDKLDYKSDYLVIYDIIKEEVGKKYGINPNIDGISSAILLSLGFEPEHGTGLFLISRSVDMLAHIVEEKSRPAWDAWKSLVGRGIINERKKDEIL